MKKGYEKDMVSL